MGEWEPPSRIIERWPADSALPRMLHEPRWEATDLWPRQNTDPWVFGDNFLYSNCRQNNKRGTPTALQKLKPGSVISFGSTISGKFVVDTVFVVAGSKAYTPRNPPATEEAFRYCTLQSITCEDNFDLSYTLYQGATLENPYSDMYSFVPCRRYDCSDYRVARPTLQLPPQYKLSCTRGPFGLKHPMSLDEVKTIWTSAKSQIRSAGCLIGLSLETPQRDDVATNEVDE